MIPAIHSYGIPVIIDSDGDITEAVDWYASVGVDGMLPPERKAGVDVSAENYRTYAALLKEYAALMGGE